MKILLLILLSTAFGWFLQSFARALDAKENWRIPARWAAAALVEIALVLYIAHLIN